MSKKHKRDNAARFYAADFKNTWLWGSPIGLSDHPEEFLKFLEETAGIQYIAATQVIRINEISEEAAAQLVEFLRNKPLPVR
jgi:hypothetical protein